MASSLDFLEDSGDPVMGRAPITPGKLNGSANLIDSESMGLFGDTTTEITGLESQQVCSLALKGLCIHFTTYYASQLAPVDHKNRCEPYVLIAGI